MVMSFSEAVEILSSSGKVLSVFSFNILKSKNPNMLSKICDLLYSKTDFNEFCIWLRKDFNIDSVCLLRTRSNKFIYMQKVNLNHSSFHENVELKNHISSLELEAIFDQPEEKTIKQNYSFSFDDVFECAALENEVYYDETIHNNQIEHNSTSNHYKLRKEKGKKNKENNSFGFEDILYF